MRKVFTLILLMGYKSLFAQFSDSVEVSYLSKVMIVFPEAIKGTPVAGSAIVKATSIDTKTLVLEGNEGLIKKFTNQGKEVPGTNLLVTSGRSYYNFYISFKEFPTYGIIDPSMYKAIYTSSGDESASNVSSETKSGYQSYDVPETFAGGDLLTQLDEAREKVIYGGEYRNVKLFYAVTNLWVNEKKLFVRVKVTNRSNTPYNIEYFRFFISDDKWGTNKKNTPRTEDLIETDKLREIRHTIEGNESYSNVFVFEKFTLFDKQNFNIQIGEENGGRKVTTSMNRKEMFIAETLE